MNEIQGVFGATNSAEKLLGHELAAAHKLAMTMMAQAARLTDLDV